MNKKEFLKALGLGLSDMAYDEQDKWLDFYSEMIEDRKEEGLSEEEAVEAIGPVDAIIRQILSQPQPEQPQASKTEKAPGKTWQIVLLIAGAPIWLSLLIAAAAIALAVVVSLCSAIIALYAVAVSLIACGFGGLVALPVLIYNGNPEAGIFSLGAGLFCAGAGIAMFVGANYLVKGMVWLCKKLFVFRRKEGAK